MAGRRRIEVALGSNTRPARRQDRLEDEVRNLAELRRNGVDVGGHQVARLMQNLGSQGVRGRPLQTTNDGELPQRSRRPMLPGLEALRDC